MDAKEFFYLVKDMREAQREYFRTRSKDVLTRSKDLERRVDYEIERTIYYRNDGKGNEQEASGGTGAEDQGGAGLDC